MIEIKNGKNIATASDLMSRDPLTINFGMSLHEAAEMLIQRAVHGAPVVDEAGLCIGVLSVSDIARAAASAYKPQAQLPQTCHYQMKSREPGGREAYLCQLPDVECPYQRLQTLSKGMVVVCSDPHCVPSDWQIVEMDSVPCETVRDYMTTNVVSPQTDTPVAELIRLVQEHEVSRLVILDPQDHTVGIVSLSDLLQCFSKADSRTDSLC